MLEFNSYLRSVTEEDLQLIYTWRNSPEIRQLMFNNEEIEWNSHIKWFDYLDSDENSEIKIFIEDKKPRGIVQINKINTYHQTAEWGFYIGDRYKKGLGSLLAYHALNYIFDELNIRKLSAQVLSINDISLKYHNKIGFKQEGLLFQHILREDKLIDVYLFAQFKKNWKYNKQVLLEAFTNG
ncbi:UDP-4-amino-4,6-dideoxy-N-acetyl-beta-L-altrosamine N-acetyltransferase [Jeotgalibacillus salarius]|uniref:UDP-4-amino-4, 6-dideoxy-N-acetyl-beta-L-altrosamine N-acetyltransferase n=1 Tax=Jeotgalibacillus salarius TaxID=546023 RepID=A0A4Y8LSJ5_9BACL|nr:UDP-4-amino-4,6-dideoxy-N-acetyl-beta-L-altrosamine N-acetyltransferase [Jeotgalibacillus salarius]TFE03935.1 UDP-4-amino-4,6-dideoxy-N-acetyl-beta-L-altrosamine N-acetyltransferase [Jeotgalibacillus salarius]